MEWVGSIFSQRIPSFPLICRLNEILLHASLEWWGPIYRVCRLHSRVSICELFKEWTKENKENTDISVVLCQVIRLKVPPLSLMSYDGYAPPLVPSSVLYSCYGGAEFSCTVPEARTRCHPTGGDTVPASDASDPCSVQWSRCCVLVRTASW